MTLNERVAARFKSKKELDSGAVVYQYSDRQVALRNKAKAERIEKLHSSIDDLRKQYRKDLGAKDPKKSLVALVVALIDETAERVGNEESAEDGHFGVTGWQRGHLKFENGKAVVNYIGKSGVKQRKVVETKSTVKALKDAYEACDRDDVDCLFASVDASDVNAYLKEYGVTAKDLRGYYANDYMRSQLKEVRKGELPKDRKERKKVLKKEFDKALADTAKAVGHEASTLRSQYLVPNLEDTYLKDGSIIDKFVKEAFQRRARCMVCPRPPTRVGTTDAGELRWYCSAHENGLSRVIDLDGGLAPSPAAYRVVERFLAGKRD